MKGLIAWIGFKMWELGDFLKDCYKGWGKAAPAIAIFLAANLLIVIACFVYLFAYVIPNFPEWIGKK